MPSRTRIAVTVAALAVLVSCTSAPPDEDPPVSVSPSEELSDEPTEEPFDPNGIDLGEEVWSFGPVGYADEPVEVALAGGTAELTFNDWEGVVEMGKPTYLDLDNDDDDDVIAPLSFLAGNQWVLTDWYAWLNRDGVLEQLVYPIESAGDCADGDATFTQNENGAVVIEQNRMAMDAACAEGAAVATTRTIEIAYDDSGDPWPLQTEPVLAWGGDCPHVIGEGDHEVTLVVAPGILTPVTPDDPPLPVAMSESWLDVAVPGWTVLGFRTESQQLPAYSCGWAQER